MVADFSLYRFRWLDTGMVISDGWLTLAETIARATETPDTMHAETIGYLVHEDENIVILAQTVDLGADAMMNAQVIAKDAVYDRYQLL